MTLSAHRERTRYPFRPTPQVYGHKAGAATGPTIAGCSVRPRSAEIGGIGKIGTEIELRFDASKLGGERVRVLNYSGSVGAGWSGVEVCTAHGLSEQYAADDSLCEAT